PEDAEILRSACVAGGPDNMPWPTHVHVDGDLLVLSRDVDESGHLVMPWDVNGVGRIMGGTATLMERDPPYNLRIELARGKINQLRCLAADWQGGGLIVPTDLNQKIRDASLAFGNAVTRTDAEEAGRLAQEALAVGCRAGEELVRTYVEQMFQVRHQRLLQLESALACRLGSTQPSPPHAELLVQTCNTVVLPFYWKDVEPSESDYRWDTYDTLLDWAQAKGLTVYAGPLIDFSPDRLPDWLWLWEKDLTSLASFMCDYVETVIKRYRDRIRSWQLTAAANCSTVLSLGEDELMWLAVRLYEAARQIDPNLNLVIG